MSQPSPDPSGDLTLLETRLSLMCTPHSRRAASAVAFAPGDVVIATPAKCGTTWLQQIVHQLRTGGNMQFQEISQVIPFLELATDLGQAKWLQPDHDHNGFRPRAFKTHLHRAFLPQRADVKYIVVLRDPAKVAGSMYDFIVPWLTVPPEKPVSIDEFVHKCFLRDDTPVLDHNCGYFHFVTSWWPHRFDSNVLFLFYENIREDHEQHVRRIAAFLGIEATDQSIQNAVRMSTFEFMKRHQTQFNENVTKRARNTHIGVPLDAGHASSKVMLGPQRPILPEALSVEIKLAWHEVVHPELSYHGLREEFKTEPVGVHLALDQGYAVARIASALLARGSRYNILAGDQSKLARQLFWKEYEKLDFDRLLRPRDTGELLCNSYCIRKGLIRKAQSYFYLLKYATKRPNSVLNTCLPESYLFELDDIDYFDEALADIYEVVANLSSDRPSTWVLKSSIVDRASDIVIFSSIEDLRSALENKWEAALEDEEVGSVSHLREWVVQRYIEKPWLASGGRKFHLRVYVVASHDLTVFVYRNILALFAREPYEKSNLLHAAGHITNTCSTTTQETLPELVLKFWDIVEISDSVKNEIYSSIKEATGQVFEAVADEPSVFQPRAGAFEVFGLDFLVDDSGGVWYLEANAFPDFKQTGTECQDVVEDLFDAIVRSVVDPWFFGDNGGFEEDEKTRLLHVVYARRSMH